MPRYKNKIARKSGVFDMSEWIAAAIGGATTCMSMGHLHCKLHKHTWGCHTMTYKPASSDQTLIHYIRERQAESIVAFSVSADIVGLISQRVKKYFEHAQNFSASNY